MGPAQSPLPNQRPVCYGTPDIMHTQALPASSCLELSSQRVLVIKKVQPAPALKELCKHVMENNMIVFVEKKVLEDPIGSDDNFGPLKRKNIMMTCPIRSILSYAGEETGPCFPRAARPPPGLPLRDPFHFENFQSQVIHVSQGNAATVLRSQGHGGAQREEGGCTQRDQRDRVLAADPGKEVGKQVMQYDVLKEVVMNRGPPPRTYPTWTST